MHLLQVDAVMFHSPTKSIMVAEIPGRCASWEAPRNNYMTCIRPFSGCCVSNKSPKLPFISAREPKATSDVPGQKGVVILTQRSRSQSTTCCGEGPAYP
jgi:hypothetical protein